MRSTGWSSPPARGSARCRDSRDLAGIHTLRTLDDCLALRADLDATPSRVVVVGAGFIGAEVAATARQRGLEVTLLEALEVPLQRVLGDRMGAVCADLHRDHGVDLRLSSGVDAFLDDGDGRVAGVVLSDGTTVDADVVVVGVGVVPNTEWLDGSGLTVDNGVVCDETCLAAPGVVAAGDVARVAEPPVRRSHAGRALGERGGAGRGTRLAACSATPRPTSRCRGSGRTSTTARSNSPAAAGRPTRSGSSTARSRSAASSPLYGRAGGLVGVLGMNRPRPVMQYRQLIADGASWDDAC